MADLEAFTDYQPSDEDLQRNPKAIPQQFGWRYQLPPGKPVRVGRLASEADWTVQDEMVSGIHVVLKWDDTAPAGGRLAVKRVDKVQPQAKRPRNPIWFQNKEVEECGLAPGEWFVIGRTRFTLRADREADRPSPVDETIVQVKQSVPRDKLSLAAFANPAAALKAMVRLPALIKSASTEAGVLRPVLRIVLDALPLADAAAVVRFQPGAAGGKGRAVVAEQHVKFPVAFGPAGFVPSQELTRRAMSGRNSCLHVWSTDLSDPGSLNPASDAQVTLAYLQSHNHVPWAICTPLQDGSNQALYVTGRVTVPGRWTALDEPAQKKIVGDLTEYQKAAELISGLTEAALRTCRLTEQIGFLRQTWPRAIWKHLDDPARLEAMLKPREKEAVTVLFCDLRNYSQFASDNAGDLIAGWKEISHALNTMGSTVTLLNGVVAGFRGDAILGFWGWPDAIPNQVATAARAAVEITERLGGFLQAKRCGLGLTHGRAVAGRLGTHDLGVVDLYGPVVNLAARLEAMTKAFGVGILVTEEFAAELKATDPFGPRTRRLGRVRVKGFNDPVTVCELAAAQTPWNDTQLADWTAALGAFETGDWKDAYDRLDELFSSDPAAQCLMRVMDRTDRTPPRGWAGAFVPVPPQER
jgi:class 3 adenylate cyclase